MDKPVMQCGFVAIVGRPNVGKSTILNAVLGQKISITSRKPQTTRHRILGIKTEHGRQVIYIDTPGIHLNAKKAINRYMNRTAFTALDDVDLVLFVVEAGVWTEEDDNVLRSVQKTHTPVMLVVNKIDHLKDKEALLPFIDQMKQKMEFREIIPVSAFAARDIQMMEKALSHYIPEGDPLFPDDQVTDKSERFLVAELIREKLIRKLHKELPYSITVAIDKFSDDGARLLIYATIWVERDSQKGIVIGKGGEVLKQVGKQARLDMEKIFERKVHLELWVKVKEGWSDNENLLKRFGYDDLPQ